MSANKNDIKNDNKEERYSYQIQHHHSSGMTPSIITTINNTSPTPPITSTSGNSGNANLKTKRPVEPYYESYIEDSFVGHWEREDDDPEDEYKIGSRGENPDGAEEDEPTLHPSTIEFDFDSFGPESFIYTPASAKRDSLDKETGANTDEAGATSNLGQNQQSIREKPIGEDASTQEPSAITSSPLDYLVDSAQIDLKVIEPYKKVISHAGYCHHFDPSASAPKPGEPAPAIIVFSACYLPDRSRRDYNYVMDHLFLYVLSSLHELIADDYILIYLHNTQPSTLSGISTKTSSSSNIANGSSSSVANEDPQHQNNLPTFTWMKRCYQMIDRKLRKNLKILYLVKPTFWLKTIVIMCKPFISAKFSKKLRFIENMEGLKKCLPVDKLILPASAENL